MTTKLEKYKAIRNLSDKEFSILSKLYEGGKHGLFEKVEHYAKYAIGALMAYVSYDLFSCADTLMGWLTAVSSLLMFFGKSITDFITSAIYSIRIVKNKEYDDALDLTDMANDLRKKQIENKIEGLKQLDNEQAED